MTNEFTTDQLQKIKYAVIATCRRRDRYMTTDAMDDVCGDVLVVLVRLALPRFDPAKGGLDPFLRECAARITRRILHDRHRSLVHPTLTTEPLRADVIAPNGFDAATIVAELCDHPEKYLQPKQCATLRIISTAAPGESNASMARRAGCPANAFAHRKSRLRRAILIVAEKFFDI